MVHMLSAKKESCGDVWSSENDFVAPGSYAVWDPFVTIR